MLEILDTAGPSEDYNLLRQQFVKHGDCFILMYSIASLSSFQNITTFYNEITKVKDTHVPIVLLGNKSDLEKKTE